MGEAKRRKKILGDVYSSPVNLEKCPMPAEISFGYVGDKELVASKAKLHKMPDDFKTTFFMALSKAMGNEQPGIVFSEALKFSGGVGVQVTFREDIETFVKSRCKVRSQALPLIRKLQDINYNTHRVIALLGGSNTPILAINVYSLQQIETLLECLNSDIPATL